MIGCGLIAGVWACSSSRNGTEFVVQMPPQTAQVMVYVSTGDGSAAQIGPAGYRAPLPGTSTAWQYANVDLLDVGSGSAKTFFYQGDDPITKLVAVGLDGSGSPASLFEGSGYDSSSSQIMQYPVMLGPIGTKQVQIWGQPQCLRVSDLQGPDGPTHEFMVADPDGDPDCDGLRDHADHECDRHVYFGALAPTLDQASCVMSVATGSVPACVLAGKACVDGQPQTDACDASTGYRLPATDCGFSLTALEDIVAANVRTSAAHLQCTFIGTADNSGGSGTAFQPCPGKTSATLQFMGQTVSCANPQLRDGSDGWSTSLTLAPGLTVAATGSNGACALVLDPGSTSEIPWQPAQPGGMAEGPFGALGAATVGMQGQAVPITVTLLMSQCDGSASQCTLE